MDEWEKSNITTLPVREDFYSQLNIEGITDADYVYVKRVCKDIEIKKCRRISWFVCWKRYIIVSWCIWELQKYVS